LVAQSLRLRDMTMQMDCQCRGHVLNSKVGPSTMASTGHASCRGSGRNKHTVDGRCIAWMHSRCLHKGHVEHVVWGALPHLMAQGSNITALQMYCQAAPGRMLFYTSTTNY
jgi:hypothetical protein